MKKMEEKTIDPRAFSEIKTILDNTGLILLIPEKEIRVIEDNMDSEYTFIFDSSRKISEHVLLEDTKKLLTYYFTRYIDQQSRIL